MVTAASATSFRSQIPFGTQKPPNGDKGFRVWETHKTEGLVWQANKACGLEGVPHGSPYSHLASSSSYISFSPSSFSFHLSLSFQSPLPTSLPFSSLVPKLVTTLTALEFPDTALSWFSPYLSGCSVVSFDGSFIMSCPLIVGVL